MRILLTNDDGYQAAGIRALYEALCEVADVIVVAPESEQSAVSLGITLTKPLRAKSIDHTGMKGYCINGTPGDCIKLALHGLLDYKPDFIFSGINQGSNVGLNANYSGTVAGAVEGAMNEVPAIAMSLLSYTSRDFSGATHAARWVLDRLKGDSLLPPYHVLSVNVPPMPKGELKGIRVAPVSQVVYREVVDKRLDPRENDYYWLGGAWHEISPTEGGDHEMTSEGYVAVTPLKIDWTARKVLQTLKQAGWDEEWNGKGEG